MPKQPKRASRKLTKKKKNRKKKSPNVTQKLKKLLLKKL